MIENEVDIFSFFKDPTWFRLLVKASQQVKLNHFTSSLKEKVIDKDELFQIETPWPQLPFWIFFFFLSFFAVSLSGSLGGCWSLSQGHKGEGRIHPCMIRQLIQGPMCAVGGLVPCSTVSQQCWNLLLQVLSTPGIALTTLGSSPQSPTDWAQY